MADKMRMANGNDPKHLPSLTLSHQVFTGQPGFILLFWTSGPRGFSFIRHWEFVPEEGN